MKSRYCSVAGVDWYFAGDRSGVAHYCEVTGETHFFHLDSLVMQELLARPDFCPEELGQALSLDSSAAEELIDQLIFLGLIDEIG